MGCSIAAETITYPSETIRFPTYPGTAAGELLMTGTGIARLWRVRMARLVVAGAGCGAAAPGRGGHPSPLVGKLTAEHPGPTPRAQRCDTNPPTPPPRAAGPDST